MAKRLAYMTSFAVVGLGTFYALSRDEGFRRAMMFNVDVLPIALHYKYVEVTTRKVSPEERSKAFGQLHARYAPTALDIVLRQKGFYVKCAQFLSQYSDALPAEYIEAFKILRDDAPAMPYAQVKQIVEQELGVPINEVFLQFEAKPVGAASIGQVHGAKFLDGSEAVVKVQYPGAERQFHIDTDLCVRLAKIIAPHYVDILQQMMKSFADEFDYRREARLQREAAERLRDVPGIVVPLPFDEKHPKCQELLRRGSTPAASLITKHVFVMERLRGISVDKWAAEQVQALAARQRCSPEEVLHRLRSMSQKEVEKLVPSDRAIRLYSLVLSARDAIRNTVAFTYNWTLGWIGSPIHYAYSAHPVNVHEVIGRLFRVQSRCIFVEGFFNADPHAGNILLLDDGRIGLIDWGQVSTLELAERGRFAQAVLAVADRDEPTIAKMAHEMGLRTENSDRWVAMKYSTFWLGSFGEDVCAELGGPTEFEQNLARIDPLISTGEKYFSAVRALMMTRGVAALMGFPFVDSARSMRSFAEDVALRHGLEVATTPGAKLPRPDVEMILGLPPRKEAATF